jgi:hypothetical protein
MTTVVRTPEFSQARILKPFAGFEAKYEGLDPSEYPIAMPGTLDHMAGQPGYDPNLLSGVPVPMGSKIKLWLPRLQNPGPYGSSPGAESLSYRYLLVWRVRSLTDANADLSRQLVGHFGRALEGVPQEASPVAAISSAGPRIVLPAAITSVQLPGLAVSVAGETATQKGQEFWADEADEYPVLPPGGVDGPYWPEPITTNVSSNAFRVFPPFAWPAPLSPNYNGQSLPGGASAKLGRAGLLSQGFYVDGNGTGNPLGVDGSTFKNQDGSKQAAFQAGPVFDVVNTEAEGDELILLVYRPLQLFEGASEVGWEFEDFDTPISAIFGSQSGPNVGAYLFTGSSAG